jgi:cytochrome P450
MDGMHDICTVTIYGRFYHDGYRAMLHNEDDYPDPFTFNPERFMKDGQLNPNIRDPDLMAFGFGRR